MIKRRRWNGIDQRATLRVELVIPAASHRVHQVMLVQALRRMALGGTALAAAQVGTIRLKLFKVAARVVVTVRRVVFHLSSSYPYQAIFREAFARVMAVVTRVMLV